MLSRIQEWAARYGPAWFIAVQTLGWITFFAIYFVLVAYNQDMGSLVRRVTSNEDIIKLAEAGGTFALAFALNRLLAPLRIVVALALLPRIAEPINKVVGPIWNKLFGNTVKATSPANEDSAKNK